MSTDPSVDPQAVEQTKRQIRGLVEEISTLAKQGLSPDEFYTGFLNRVVEALAAVGGAVWTLTEAGQFRLAYQINLHRASLDEDGEHQVRHARLISQVAQTGEGLLVPPHSGGGDENAGANPTEQLLVLAPLTSDRKVEGVVEIFQRATPNPATRRGYLRFLIQMCDLAGEWHKTYRLQQFHDQQALWSQADDFSRTIHDSLDLRLTAYTIANEAQRLIGCDRVSVAVRRGNRFVVEAVSGQDLFEARSDVVKLLGRLATKVVAMGEPLWYVGFTDDFPPQIEEAVQEYVDHAHTKTIAVLPLVQPATESDETNTDAAERVVDEGTVVGAMIVEQIEDVRSQHDMADRVNLVSGHAARALANAYEHNSLFLLPLWRSLGRARWVLRAKTLPKTLAVVAGVTAVLLALLLIPADFALTGKGQLQPIHKQDVFADYEGTVSRVLVRHGERVEQGQLLAELESTSLDVQLEGVIGQEAETFAKWQSAATQRRNSSLPAAERNFYAAQAKEYQELLASLRLQRKMLEEQKDRMEVKSPITGQVVTWDVQNLLLQRPVNRGEVLMSVADTQGEWELEISMPENRIGHVMEAVQEYGKELTVEFITATSPNAPLTGTVREIHRSAELSEEHGHVVRILVDIDEQQLKDPRPGATVTAKVQCGTRSIGYVWLHELLEWFQSRVLFHL